MINLTFEVLLMLRVRQRKRWDTRCFPLKILGTHVKKYIGNTKS